MRIALIFAYMLSLGAADLCADNLRVEVPGASPQDASAVGLILSEQGIKEIPQTRVEKSANKSGSTVLIDGVQLSKDETASALLLDNQGSLYVGQALGPQSPLHKSNKSPCPQTVVDNNKLSGDEALLQKLVDIRSERRKLLDASIQSKLSGELLQKLQKVESGLGLATKAELSSELEPLELLERLWKLNASIQNIKSQRSLK